MWTMHTAIPDMRTTARCENAEYKMKKKSLSTKYLIKKCGLAFKHDASTSMVVFSQGDFYHHKKSDNKNNTIYYINICLVKEVVGENEHDINGYVLEFLAYGFFDKNVRKSLKANNRNKRLFEPSENTCIQDRLTMKQYQKVFAYGA